MFNLKSTELSSSVLPHILHNAIAVDCGITMSRIVVVVENDYQNFIRYISEENKHLTDILRDIKEMKISFEKSFITGFNKSWAKLAVKSVFDLEPIVIEEDEALSNGFQLVSDNFGMDHLQCKAGNLAGLWDRYPIDENNPMIQQIRKATHFEVEEDLETDENKIKMPAFLILVGSFVRIFYVSQDKIIKPINTMVNGRLTFAGLAKCLIDLNDHSKIIKLAENGNRESVDTQCWEMFSENEKSPYGRLPPNFPIFPFGKGADHETLELNESDLMHSLCNLVSNNIVSLVNKLCKMFKTKRFYICGSLYDASVFEKILAFQSERFVGKYDIKRINCEWLLALGTLKM